MKPRDLPDILFISVDTLRRDRLAPYGADLMPTATRLVEEGIAFDRCVSAAPWTGSSFGSIFTGLWPRQHGFLVNLLTPRGPWRSAALKPDARLLSEMLRSAGYHAVAAQGNPGCLGPEFGMTRGFDEYFMWNPIEARWAGWKAERQTLRRAFEFAGPGRCVRLALHRIEAAFDKSGLPDRSPLETAPALVDASARMLRRSPGDRPVFLWVNFVDLHEPYCVPRGWERRLSLPRSRTRPVHLSPALCFDETLGDEDKESMIERYDLIAQFVDLNIRRLLGLRDACRPGRSRLTVFVSDHGEEFWDHGTDLRSEDYYARGVAHGHTLFGELINVPWAIHWPDSGLRRRRVGGLVSLVDLVPTLVDLLDLREETALLPGVSQMPAVGSGRPREEEDRIVFSDANYYGPPIEAAVSETHKLVRHVETGKEELYAWSDDDPKERTDLSQSAPHAGIRRGLAGALDRWNSRISADAASRTLDEREKEDVAKRLKAWGYL